MQYVILCEDLQTQVFIRRALVKRGANPRRILLVDLPATKDEGSGDGYVAIQYPKQVEAHRSRAAHTEAALIAHMDADKKFSVEMRMARFEKALNDAGLAARGASERISHLVPRRNIETWIHFYLGGPPIDEITEYSKYTGRESECWPAAEAFSEDAARQRVPGEALPSLLVGLSEFRRVL